jgi:superfamily II DNA or RNA helicase
MPTAFTQNGIRFFFYSNENEEPIHVHVEKGDAIGKIWLEPAVKIAYFDGFTASERRAIIQIVSENEVTLRNKWNEHFSQ